MQFQTDIAVVAAYARRTLALGDAKLSEEYLYQSLPLCAIDAVYSIGVSYAATRLVVSRYCAYTSQARIRAHHELPPITEQESVSSFCARPEQQDWLSMAERVYGNRQRTSTRSGILKAEAVYRFAESLRSFGVEYLQDVHQVVEDAEFEASVRSIPGQRSGISLQYFWMLAGSENLIKPDRMVLRFLRDALSRTVYVHEAMALLVGTCHHLSEEFPQLNPRLLDFEVWKYQRTATGA